MLLRGHDAKPRAGSAGWRAHALRALLRGHGERCAAAAACAVSGRQPTSGTITSPPYRQTAADVSVSMQHDFNSGQQGGSGFKLNFDVRELNLVCRI